MFSRSEIDTRRFRACNENEIFNLTAMELRLIMFFYKNPDVVLSCDQLLNAVWGIDYYGTARTLCHINQSIKIRITQIEGDALPLTTPAHDVFHQKVTFDRQGISSFSLL